MQQSFLLIWFGQTVSRFGTYMTTFALLSIWVWEQTGQATSIALVVSATTLASLMAALVGGAIVDRYARKTVMIAADLIAASGTVMYLFLLAQDNLQIWHLVVISGFVGFFAQLHGLALSAATSMMISKKHYARAGGMRYVSHYGAVILSPALAAMLYKPIGLEAIMLIDLATVSIAVLTAAFVTIPEPPESERGKQSRQNRWLELSYGLRYAWQSVPLRWMLLHMTLFSFFHNLGFGHAGSDDYVRDEQQCRFAGVSWCSEWNRWFDRRTDNECLGWVIQTDRQLVDGDGDCRVVAAGVQSGTECAGLAAV